VKRILRNIFLSKYGLLIIAAALFSLSFAFNKIYTNSSSFAKEIRFAEKYIRNNQKDFESFIKDSFLIKDLISTRISKDRFTSFTNKEYGVFLYRINYSGNWGVAAWSNQVAEPPIEAFSKSDGEYYMRLPNGYYYVVKKT